MNENLLKYSPKEVLPTLSWLRTLPGFCQNKWQGTIQGSLPKVDIYIYNVFQGTGISLVAGQRQDNWVVRRWAIFLGFEQQSLALPFSALGNEIMTNSQFSINHSLETRWGCPLPGVKFYLHQNRFCGNQDFDTVEGIDWEETIARREWSVFKDPYEGLDFVMKLKESISQACLAVHR